MAKIPQFDKLQNILDSGSVVKDFRPYLGYSSTGGACTRKMYYDFRWAYKCVISDRMIRLFARGDYEEKLVIDYLVSKGIIISDRQREVVGPHEHVLGHIEGILVGITGDED